MKKKIKASSGLFDKKLNLIFDPNLKSLPLSESLARKIEEGNEHLLKIKNLDEILKRHANDFSPE